MVQIHSITVPVGTSATEIIGFFPKDLSSLLVKCSDALYIGSGNPSFPLDAGQPFSLSHDDFSEEAIKANNYVKLYAKAAADTTVHILVLRR